MNQQEYLLTIRDELESWTIDMIKSPNMFVKATNQVQGKVQQVIPEKVHQVITTTMKSIVHSVLFSMKFVPNREPLVGVSLKERDEKATELVQRYKKIAAVEGAGTGVGGFILGMVDFPALIAIKIRFLFELAHVYGYDTRDQKERLFILYIFQLTFSSHPRRVQIFEAVEDWDKLEATPIDWEEFQKDYRDSLDFRKILQLIPWVGAVIGAWANYRFLEELGEVGVNSYRLRILSHQSIE